MSICMAEPCWDEDGLDETVVKQHVYREYSRTPDQVNSNRSNSHVSSEQHGSI